MPWQRQWSAASQRKSPPEGLAPLPFGLPAAIRFLPLFGALLCWCLSASLCLGEKKVELPRGYGEAAPAQPRPLPRAAAPAPAAAASAAAGQSILDILTEQLDAADPQVLALERQYTSRMKPFLQAELVFIQGVCAADRKQYEAIATDANTRFRRAVREYAVAMNGIQQRGMRAGQQSVPQPETLIQKEVAPILKARLSPEQFKRYEKECHDRVDRRKRAVVMNLVVKLDEDLRLTGDQRSKLVEVLTENYQNNWDQWIELIHHSIHATPNIPQQCLTQVLNEDQQKVWMQLPKTNASIAMGAFAAQPIVVIEEEEMVWEGDANAQ